MVNRPDLVYPPFTPGIPKGLNRKNNIFEAVARKDYLLLHPFESFAPVVQILRQAAKDPHVLAIKQTLYRTGSQSAIVDALIDAARNGKEVTAVVELRARFDEEENLELASRLQEAGAVVVYGVVGYKTHCKMMLVVRRENQELNRYIHLGTGNYHSGNARLYTDYSLLTSDKELCEDVHLVFQQLTGMGQTERTSKLLYAPFTLKRQMLKMIDNEIKAQKEGQQGHIIFKCNGLTESKIIQALYRASIEGVRVELIVRGMCCLKPGIAGISENIRVISVLGRFLEHSRVYFFANSTPSVYCSSADLMERNLNRRVEVSFPIQQPSLAQRIKNELQLYLDSTGGSWALGKDATYSSAQEEENTAAQAILLQELAG